MLTYSQASNTARRANFDEAYSRAFNDSPPGPGVKLLRIDGRFEDQSTNGRIRRLRDAKTATEMAARSRSFLRMSSLGVRLPGMASGSKSCSP